MEDQEIDEEGDRSTPRILYKGQEAYLKIHHEPDEGPDALYQELRVYQHLRSQNCQIMPRIMALIIKDSKVVGFMTKLLEGREPDFCEKQEILEKEWVICEKGLAELHSFGVAHGDVFDRANIKIVNEEYAMFYDFEVSKIKNENPEHFEEQCAEDMQMFRESAY